MLGEITININNSSETTQHRVSFAFYFSETSFHILAPRGFASERAAWSWLSRFSPPAEASVRLLPPFDGACLVFHKFTVK